MGDKVVSVGYASPDQEGQVHETFRGQSEAASHLGSGPHGTFLPP